MTYDGKPHEVEVSGFSGIGKISVIYRDAYGMESMEAPSAVGKYDVSIKVEEGELFFATVLEEVVSFTISIMDEVEWNTLQELYIMTDGANSWTRKWNIEGGIAAAATYYGVKYENGHVVELNLENLNLQGTLPVSVFTLPYLEKLNLSNNKLTGKIDSMMAKAELMGNVSYVDISANNMMGNIAAIMVCCPNLKTLYAGRNRFSEVYPALPANLTVDLSEQTIDEVLLWYKVVSVNNSTSELPTMLTYNHSNQNYASPEWYVSTNWDNIDWSLWMNVDATNGGTAISTTEDNYVFYGKSGDTLDVTTLSPTVSSGSKAKIVYKFEKGDADFSSGVDVLDLQSTINFIFKEYQNYPFNHTAANVQSKDDVIDVLDVIALVDLLMNDTVSVESPSLARARVNTFAAAADADAYLYWEDNRLILETVKDVAALDIALRGQATYQWNKTLGMTVVSSEEDTHQRIIGYSMSRKYIPQGKHVLLTATAPCEIATALVADRAAQKVDVALKAPEHTEIETVASTQLQCRYQDGWLQLCVDGAWEEMQWEVYATDGRLLAKGTLPYAESGVANLWHTDTKSTVIVLLKDNNGIVLTQKVNIIK